MASYPSAADDHVDIQARLKAMESIQKESNALLVQLNKRVEQMGKDVAVLEDNAEKCREAGIPEPRPDQGRMRMEDSEQISRTGLPRFAVSTYIQTETFVDADGFCMTHLSYWDTSETRPTWCAN